MTDLVAQESDFIGLLIAHARTEKWASNVLDSSIPSRYFSTPAGPWAVSQLRTSAGKGSSPYVLVD